MAKSGLNGFMQTLAKDGKRKKQDKKMLEYKEYLQFMHIFLSLHDTVVTKVEKGFEKVLGLPAMDSHISLLCSLISFNT